MAIMLTITDDQALEIVSQISSALANKRQGGGSVKETKTVTQEVHAMKKGDTFRNIDMQFKTGKDCGAVSAELKRLRGEGKIEMLRRGTYEVIK